MPAHPIASNANRPTSLKLPSALKAQLEADAQQMGMSLHAFMLQTLAESAQRTRLRQSFAQDSAQALADVKAAGSAYALGDVRAHFAQVRQHRQGQGPKPQDLTPQRFA